MCRTYQEGGRSAVESVAVDGEVVAPTDAFAQTVLPPVKTASISDVGEHHGPGRLSWDTQNSFSVFILCL